MRISLLALALGAGLGVAALLAFLPALRGAACPRCFGLEPAGGGLWVEASMPAHARAALAAEVRAARARIAAFYGPPRAHLRLIACETAACDRRLGGRGAAAVTYSLGPVSVVRLAPRGLSATVLTHELAHAETHAQLGLRGQLGGRLPTWFDEGLSVVISDDRRYLGPGQGVARCRRAPRADLPATPFDWAPLAARDPGLYAEAGCAVLHWLQDSGGAAGLRARFAAAAALP
ncbi:hypothetical protein SDC9_18840 [bioreactor metagenome]|uniref:Uncharacterized protein n=1 Tax=bioreactor metagenome TaxID=1076179 RepID=A0A644U2U8_9ZZZZ